MQCSNQYIMGPTGPVELMMSAVFSLYELNGIPLEEHLDAWTRIKKISHTLLKACKDKAELEAKAKKNRGH